MSEAVTVTMADVRRSGMCARGARVFFVRHNLDWPAFLRTGLPANVLRDTGDAMAIQVCEAAEKEADGR